MTKRTKRILGAIVVLALAAGGSWYYLQDRNGTTTALSTVAVSRGKVERTVLATGLIEAEDLVSVGARTSGQIETLAVDVGDDVKAGDLIAEIDSLEQQNAVEQAKADLDQLEAQIASKQAEITKAEQDVARQTTLSASRAGTTADLQEAEATLAIAQADLKALEAQKTGAEIEVSSAELDLSRTKITAPIDGTVVAVVNGEGTTVNASQEAPTIVKLAQLDRMKVKAEISEADVVNVAAGQAVEFSLLGDPDRVFTSELAMIEPAPSSIEDDDEIDTDEAVYYNARFTVDNPDRVLRIGMSTDVTIILDRVEDVLTLPLSALAGPGPDGGYMAQVLTDAATGTTEMHKVTVGLQNSVTAEITSGLEEGDEVVTSNVPSGPPPDSSSSDRRGPPGMMF